MKSPEWLRLARAEFSTGKTLLVIRDGDPQKLRHRLRIAATRRGYSTWHMAIDGERVVIQYKALTKTINKTLTKS